MDTVNCSAPAPRVLLVDDDELILSSLRRLFAFRGVDVEIMSDAREALDCLNLNQFDIILSDLSMPGMSGLEFLACAAQVQPQAYRVLLSGYGDLSPGDKTAVQGDNIHRYVAKPWKTDQLLAIVHEGVSASRAWRS